MHPTVDGNVKSLNHDKILWETLKNNKLLKTKKYWKWIVSEVVAWF